MDERRGDGQPPSAGSGDGYVAFIPARGTGAAPREGGDAAGLPDTGPATGGRPIEGPAGAAAGAAGPPWGPSDGGPADGGPGTVPGRRDGRGTGDGAAPPGQAGGLAGLDAWSTPGAADGARHAPSTYLRYLPTLYQGDEFLGRFLRIFEDILSPIERMIDTVADALDPRLAPERFLPWLASWLGVELDENWPLEQQRELILRAAALYRWRGTRRGLREHLRIYTRRPPLIVENFTGLRLGQDASLGVNTRLGTYRPDCVYVTVLADRPEALDEGVLQRIVEASKPAHVGYLLEVRASA